MFKNPRAFVSANLEYSSNEAAVSDKYARFRSNSKLAGAFDVHICSGLQVDRGSLPFEQNGPKEDIDDLRVVVRICPL